MKLSVRVDWLNTLGPAWKKELSYRSPDQWHDHDIEEFDEAELKAVIAIAEKNIEVKGARALLLKIKMYRGLLIDAGNTKIVRLEAVVKAMKLLMLKHAPSRWLFTENEDGKLVPWYVYRVVYEAPDARRGNSASATIAMAAVRRDVTVSDSIVLHVTDIRGNTMNEILNKQGYFLETPEVVKQYGLDMEYYNKLAPQTGKQFSAFETAFSLSDRWSGKVTAMVRDGHPARVVMDDENSEGSEHERSREGNVNGSFWSEDIRGKNTDADEEEVPLLPIQPYVKVFDLAKHTFLRIHVCNLKAYEWDSSLIGKLVLPAELKDLVSMLIHGADLEMEDIIRGKTGGIIVISTGQPGIGKTLTAEVFSEEVKRPLYNVQCSQLGTDEKKLEESLLVVLGRAERWGAILLIDEADVYVSERGTDIQQNAIVGTFLRVLEYYHGILFMTSNRETIIDDAILSRGTAWIRYELPTREQAAEIWRVLSTQYKVKLTESDIEALLDAPEFQPISGRTIKSLLKLARLLLARKKEPITPKTIRYLSQFIKLERSKDHARDNSHNNEKAREAAGAAR